MLLASAFMLNHSAATEQWTIYPWALSSCNQLSDAEQLRPVRCASQPLFPPFFNPRVYLGSALHGQLRVRAFL